MHFSTTIAAIILAVTSLVAAGGPEICTKRTDGTGGTDYQVTKDCCAAVKHKAYFNEVVKECWPNAGPWGNSVNTGEMVKCCASRGCGSSAV
ncbi:hypothetical protein VNI00_017830 [Paramarasmius palmivorus]|uniref:Uncharacterized protein n=1 Tax=Paramarasmius palmivorus TaxID=297713 RepID=A0AAW0B5I4_9AGAR